MQHTKIESNTRLFNDTPSNRQVTCRMRNDVTGIIMEYDLGSILEEIFVFRFEVQYRHFPGGNKEEV